ncbi:M48 family metallopeptidase [Treponema sp.]|uniref:M48 family metallopeptidase n=1 Tax=Treponema sp. TaxID=166 RepID=UPI003890697C
MNYSNIFVILFLAGTFYDFFINQLLEFTDWSFRKKHGTEVPKELEGHIDEEKLKQVCAYEDAKYFFWIPKNVVNLAISLALVLSGFYVLVFNLSWNWTNNVYLTILLFVFLSSIPSTVLMIPFNLYREFKIEKKFGFSNMTLKMYILDSIKETLVSLLIAVPLILAAVAFIGHFEKLWWLYFGLVYLAIALGLSYVYPIWIAPLFNKFVPLEDGELKTKIEALFAKTGFKTSGIFTMDASKRSNHSNAYFTGLGKNKRIVLYDTLVNQLTTEEVVAVLAHELGHCKHHHITKRMCVMIPVIFACLFAVSVLIRNDSLYTGFGFDTSNGFAALKFVGIFLLGLSFGGFDSLASLISNASSRRDEFQADRYSKDMCGTGTPLSTALIKLNKENLSEIVPPKIYSVFNYSHPPLLERIRAVDGLK